MLCLIQRRIRPMRPQGARGRKQEGSAHIYADRCVQYGGLSPDVVPVETGYGLVV